MFQVKVLSRNPDEYMRDTVDDIRKVPRNYDPTLHPFESSREYVRALNAVKLERVFAKPFIGSLDGHKDDIMCVIKHPERLSLIASGSADGEIRLWDLSSRSCARTLCAHSQMVNGLSFPHNGSTLFSVSGDRTVKKWNLSDLEHNLGTDPAPIDTIVSRTVLTGIHHHRKDPVYVTSGDCVHIWEDSKAEPIRTMQWGDSTVSSVQFNHVETNVIGACLSNTSVMLYDMREAQPIRKVIMKMHCNRLRWNPMEAFVFTLASDDYKSYTFDMRKLTKPLVSHVGHVAPVLDVDYSPTGKEFVTVGYDRTVRIFPYDSMTARELYHTPRMHRVFSVLWSQDNKYIMCGSTDMNIRIWKSKAWEQMGILQHRQKAALDYNDKLKEKFANHPQVKRIVRHRHMPRTLYNQQKTLRIMLGAQSKRFANRLTRHRQSWRTKGTPDPKPEWKVSVMKEEA
jgi:WD repeat and SOF domain-containing protein 1